MLSIYTFIKTTISVPTYSFLLIHDGFKVYLINMQSIHNHFIFSGFRRENNKVIPTNLIYVGSYLNLEKNGSILPGLPTEEAILPGKQGMKSILLFLCQTQGSIILSVIVSRNAGIYYAWVYTLHKNRWKNAHLIWQGLQLFSIWCLRSWAWIRKWALTKSLMNISDFKFLRVVLSYQ